MLIGLCGLPSNGKGTIATRLATQHGFLHTKFAAPMKDMLRVMLRHAGATEEIIERMIEGDLKEVPSPLLGGKTPRWAMQTIGTEWGRDCISPTLWGDLWQSKAHTVLEDGGSLVVDDVRFPNEQERVKRLGGFIVMVNGRNGTASEHPSDRMDWLVPDYVIENDGTMQELETKVDQLVQRIREDVWK